MAIAKGLRCVAGELRAETDDGAARELEARWALQLAETQDREGETGAREAATADSRAQKASLRPKHRP